MSAITILTRRRLYDLAWFKPMRDLANELGLSDPGLAKICKRHRIPTPGRGYWARHQAGQKLKRAVFVELKDSRLVAWARRRLVQLELMVARENLEEDLHANRMFPVPDDLQAPAPD